MNNDKPEDETKNKTSCSGHVEPVVMCFPKHNASMTVIHNDHKNYYQNASEWIMENSMYDWENEEEKQKAIHSDSIWTIQWYPNTPVSFFSVAAATLESALAFANKNS